MDGGRDRVKNEQSFARVGRMPRVTDEHRDRRRAQILDAARRCFARDGFHQTSMTDLLTEAGLSAGAFYRYFRSKDEVIVLIAEQGLSRLGGILDRLAGSGDACSLGEIVGEIARGMALVDRDELSHQLLVAVQGWSEALRNEDLRASVRSGFADAHAHLVRVIATSQAAGGIRADLDPHLGARVVLALVPGFILQLTVVGDVDADGFADAAVAVLDGR